MGIENVQHELIMTMLHLAWYLFFLPEKENKMQKQKTILLCLQIEFYDSKYATF
jgi:hypothetical protein